MEYPINVNILGTEYTIEKHSYKEDNELVGLGGYCRYLVPTIVIGDFKTNDSYRDETEEFLDKLEKSTLRHEILHAFLNESGIGQNAFASDTIPWSQNEEMIDWFALQSPKIMNVYKTVGCL